MYYKMPKKILICLKFQECSENITEPDISEQMYRAALRLIIFFERWDRMNSGSDIKAYESGPKPTVLVFLPGIFEIRQMYHRLEEWAFLYVSKFVNKCFEKELTEKNTISNHFFLLNQKMICSSVCCFY